VNGTSGQATTGNTSRKGSGASRILGAAKAESSTARSSAALPIEGEGGSGRLARTRRSFARTTSAGLGYQFPFPGARRSLLHPRRRSWRRAQDPLCLALWLVQGLFASTRRSIVNDYSGERSLESARYDRRPYPPEHSPQHLDRIPFPCAKSRSPVAHANASPPSKNRLLSDAQSPVP
jgi:hypothetical protein